jgi:hypothetical protein
MKRLIAAAVVPGVVLVVACTADSAHAYYEAAWDFVCEWECGEAYFPYEYGGYTLNGYASVYFDELPATEYEAYTWAYYDFWQTANCEQFSTTFSQMVCFDTAFLHGVDGWYEFANLYWGYSDDELACRVIDERAYWHDNGSPYSEGWLNRDAALADIGGCW